MAYETEFCDRYRRSPRRLARLWYAALLAGSMLAASPTAAQAVTFNIPAQSVGAALDAYARQAGVKVLFPYDGLNAITSRPLVGTYDRNQALARLIEGTGLEIVRGSDGIIALRRRVPSAAINEASPSPRLAYAPLAAPQVPDSAALPELDEPAVMGRTAAATSDDDETIIVTGTLIRGIAPESSPTQVYSRADIRAAGVASLEEFVDRLPQNFGGGSTAETVGLVNDRATGFNQSGGTGVNLRGLGSGSTLVLLNGRRLAPSGGLGDFVDISILPLNAIERVEVVTDGASAIYGADAIGGVINFRLRDDFDGVETFVRYGAATEGRLDEFRTGVTAGTAWTGGGALLAYDYFDRDALSVEERDFADAALRPNDILPDQRRHSVIATLSQQLSSAIGLRMHGLYGHRTSRRTATTSLTPRNTNLTRATSEQFGLAATVDIDLGADWSAAIAGDFFNVAEDQARTLFSPAVTGNDSEIWTIEGLLNGPLIDLPAGPARLAIGASHRGERFSSRNRTTSRLSARDARGVDALYGELFVPIIGPAASVPGFRRLELSLAGRYEDFSRFGQTFNPKVGALWSPLDGVRLRSSYGTSFNAPNLADLGSTFSGASVFILPDPTSPGGTSVVLTDSRANRDLQPEEATTWSAGFDVDQPMGPGTLTLSGTYYDIDYDGRIGVPSGNAALFLTNPAFAAAVTRDPPLARAQNIVADALAAGSFFNLAGARWAAPGDEDAIFDNRLRNQASDVTRGLDFRVAYRTAVAGGDLKATLDGNHVLSYERQIIPTSPVIDVVDTIFNPADLRLRGGLAWAGSSATAAIFVNHVGGYRDDRTTPARAVAAWTTVDLSVGYDTGDSRLLSNTRFALSVQNVLDEDPPLLGTDPLGGRFGYDPTNASPLGRFVALQVTKRW